MLVMVRSDYVTLGQVWSVYFSLYEVSLV